MQRSINCSLRLAATFAILAASSARSADLPKCCVWRVTNAKAPFYLVGSMHVLSPRDYPLPSPYEMALRDSKRFVFEYDPKLGTVFSKKFDIAAKYPPGHDSRTTLHPKLLAWMRNNVRSVEVHKDKNNKEHVTVGSFDHMLNIRPWALAMTMGIPGYSDISGDRGVDAYFAKHAKTSGEETAGLETPDEHVAVLSGMPDRDGQIVLLDTIVYADRSQNDFYKLRAKWRHGDLAAVWASGARQRKEAFWIEQRLIDQRNIKWIPQIVAELKTGKPTSIVAGAMHFCGPNSVVTLLQQRGYTIEQL